MVHPAAAHDVEVLRLLLTAAAVKRRRSQLPTVAKDDSGKKWTWSCEGGKNRPMMSGNRFTVVIEEVELEEMGSTVELPDAAAGMKCFRITIGASGMHKINQAMVQAIEDELIKSKSS